MKILKYGSLILVLTVALFTSCSKKDAVISKLDESFKAWESFKASSNNSYSYVSLVGKPNENYNETKVTIVKGEIVARDYYSYEYVYTSNQAGVKTVIKEWHETPTTIGTHGGEGADLFTLDDIYTRARNNWLSADKSKYNVSFEANNDGMISVAGYEPKTCADYCFIGVKLTSIKK